MKLHNCLLLLSLTAIIACGCSPSETKQERRLLNVSYDPTRELYQEINQAFTAQPGMTDVIIEQSHGGSGKQARAVLDGLEADVVTLALGYDIDILADKGKLLPDNWQERLPNQSTPYYSTIVFLVHAGNPKKIMDWSDLTRDGIEVIMPNPKTSGGARWNYLAAFAWAQKQFNSEDKALEYLAALFAHIPVLDTGARGATNTFVQQGKGDVLISWENEALLAMRDFPGKYEIVYPSLSIKAEPSVTVVDANIDNHDTCKLANEYLTFLYSETAQIIEAKNFYRPNAPAPSVDLSLFKPMALVTIADFGGWKAAHEKHFGTNGTCEKIMAKR